MPQPPLWPAPAGATLLSFVVAILHFSLELLVFKTMTWQYAVQPMVVAGEWGRAPRGSRGRAQLFMLGMRVWAA